jgi:hypothetical protein
MFATDERPRLLMLQGLAFIIGYLLGTRLYWAVRESVNAFDPIFPQLIWLGIGAAILGILLWLLSLRVRKHVFPFLLLAIASCTSLVAGLMLVFTILSTSAIILHS